MKNVCFRCKRRPGLDCPGRRPNENTLCLKCFKLTMLWSCTLDWIHQMKYFLKYDGKDKYDN